ncbi:hypothetical protein [Bradyrhizobium shewense]|uniref:hypothetical protein n=1 Tax=Bradyrhizobium shewense TaxID=1761772 RepID=UPI001FD8C9C0|nr:hypothetical protein [Bradyrhizobium shewense]
MKLLLSIASLVYIARGLDLPQLRNHLVSVDPLLFVLALALIFFQTFVLNGPRASSCFPRSQSRWGRDLAGQSGARLVFSGEGRGRIADLVAGEGRGGIEPHP